MTLKNVTIYTYYRSGVQSSTKKEVTNESMAKDIENTQLRNTAARAALLQLYDPQIWIACSLFLYPDTVGDHFYAVAKAH